MSTTNFDSFDTSRINRSLVCPLCQGYFREAHTLGECLHTFCKSCIYVYFVRDRNHVCPTCNINLKPQPLATLRYDRTVQEIVDTLFPTLDGDDALKERDFLSARNLPVPQSVLDKIPSATSGSSGAGSGPTDADLDVKLAVGDESGKLGDKAKMEYSDAVTFHLLPDEHCDNPLPAMDNSALRTTAAITVQALKKYIVKKLKLGIKPKKLALKYGDTNLGAEHTLSYILKTIAYDDQVPSFNYSLNMF